MKRIIILFTVFLFIGGCASQSQNLQTNTQQEPNHPEKEVKTVITDYSLDSQLGNLTNQIVESLTRKQKSKIAVIEFSDLDGNITEFGKYLAEELITRLFLTNRFEVVERNLLNKILEEHKLNMSGLIDENTIKEVGKLLGVEAIASGSITDLGENVKVNARLISTETGSVFSVASVKIEKNETVGLLLNKIYSTSQFFTKSKKDKQTKTISLNKGDVFFKEDFGDYKEWDQLPDWAENSVIRRGSDGRKYITALNPGKTVISKDIDFPDDFSFEYDWKNYCDKSNSTSGDAGKYVYFELIDENGDIFLIKCGCYGAILPDLQGIDFREQAMNSFKLVKKGSVYRIYNNGQFLLSHSYPNYSNFVKIKITIPVNNKGQGQYFTNLIGTKL